MQHSPHAGNQKLMKLLFCALPALTASLRKDREPASPTGASCYRHQIPQTAEAIGARAVPARSAHNREGERPIYSTPVAHATVLRARDGSRSRGGVKRRFSSTPRSTKFLKPVL